MYSIAIDAGTTKLIRAVVGGQPSAEEIERFDRELQAQARALRAGGPFDVLMDLREAATLPQALTGAVQESMKRLASAGMRRNAYLVASMLLKMQFDRMAISPAFACFRSEEEALAWLAS